MGNGLSDYCIACVKLQSEEKISYDKRQSWFKQYLFTVTLTYYDIYMHTIFLEFGGKRCAYM